MASQWDRKRSPDDVPTPTAVAVSDFCRRARASAPPAEVREALALLAPEEEFRVRALTDQEPAATPLGPFAVVDILRGTSPQLAAQRQSCGYYDVVRELVAALVALTVPPVPSPLPPAARTPPPPAPAPPRSAAAPEPARADTKPSPPTVSERIAPKKRASAPAEPPSEPMPSSEPEFRKKQLPEPRGRFTRLSAQKLPASELLEEPSRDMLSALAEQHRHRPALLRALAGEYSGTKGPLSATDLDAALQHHGLLEQLERSERELLLASYAEHKGATGRVAWALGLSPPELDKLIRSLGLKAEVDEARERFKREALSPQHLTQRLDLLGRTKYLSDLGITQRFQESLARDLRSLLRSSLGGASSLTALTELTARKHGAPAELLSRAMDRLGLTEEFRKLVSAETPTHLP